MSENLIQRMRRRQATRRGRALWLALGLLLLAVQTALPAHLASHHLGQAPDVHCQYCVLGGHVYSPTSSTPPIAVIAYRPEEPVCILTAQAVASCPLTVSSRGPPSRIDA